MIPINAVSSSGPPSVLLGDISVGNREVALNASAGVIHANPLFGARAEVNGNNEGGRRRTRPRNSANSTRAVRGTAVEKMERSLRPRMNILGYSTAIMEGLSLGMRSAIVWEFIDSYQLGQSYVGELCGVARGDVTKAHLTAHQYNDLCRSFHDAAASSMAVKHANLDPERLQRMCQWYLACVKHPERFEKFVVLLREENQIKWHFNYTGRSDSSKKRAKNCPSHPFTVRLQKAKAASVGAKLAEVAERADPAQGNIPRAPMPVGLVNLAPANDHISLARVAEIVQPNQQFLEGAVIAPPAPARQGPRLSQHAGTAVQPAQLVLPDRSYHSHLSLIGGAVASAQLSPDVQSSHASAFHRVPTRQATFFGQQSNAMPLAPLFPATGPANHASLEGLDQLPSIAQLAQLPPHVAAVLALLLEASLFGNRPGQQLPPITAHFSKLAGTTPSTANPSIFSLPNLFFPQ